MLEEDTSLGSDVTPLSTKDVEFVIGVSGVYVKVVSSTIFSYFSTSLIQIEFSDREALIGLTYRESYR